MKIAILGYGKMGKEIEIAALKLKHDIFLKVDSREELENNIEELRFCNVAIDFTVPGEALNNILTCFEANVPIVIGTTGWYEHLAEIKHICEDMDQTLMYSPNFSIGVNIFYEINNKLARIMNKFNNYDVEIEESHHVNKLDKPSGTAIFIANGIIENLERKKSWVLNTPLRHSELYINSIREGNIIGEHKVSYNSDIDSITIRHEAKSREGFAQGAVLAAEWIADKKGVFTMADFMKA